MDAFARETPDIRAEVFRETAARMSILPAIVEKEARPPTLKRLLGLELAGEGSRELS